MKIYFIANQNDGCGYYRAYLPAKFINGLFDKAKCSIDWFNMSAPSYPPASAMSTFKKKIEFAMSADIVVFQRPVSSGALKEIHRLRTQTTTKVVFENDDLMEEVDNESPMKYTNYVPEIYNLALEGAHLVTTTTRYLQKHFLKRNPNVCLLENSLDFSMFPQAQRPGYGELRILLSGSVAFRDNARGFYKTLKAIIDHYPHVKFLIHGLDQPEHLETLRKELPDVVSKLEKQWEVWKLIREHVEFIPYTPVFDYPKVTAALRPTLALIPRKENNFNRAKSNLKYLEMAAMKIPVIAQKFTTHDSPYENDIVDGETGYLANTSEEWLEKIELALSNKTIADNAYNYVREYYDIKNNIDKWKDAYRKLLS